jgi:aromatic-L-amino-acid decarboxylase
MIDLTEFRIQANEMVDWMVHYYENIESFPVKPDIPPGEILSRLPAAPPSAGESMDDIFRDFKNTILPGMTHWQNPSFFAYFPANSSYPSVLAEMLTAALGAQCMVWETSPAAAELEERMMQWLRQMLGLPSSWEGVIQDTASTSTLTAILTAREKYTGFSSNKQGLSGLPVFRIYGSTETHSSIEKAVKIAGIGQENFVKIKPDDHLRLDPAKLSQAIEADRKTGKTPLAVIATLGTTGTTAIDDIEAIGNVCQEHHIWLHVDAALAGTALLLPEFRWMIRGIERADSFVFNPHKWMFTNFDCSAYFIRDKESLICTFEILPEYLKTKTRGKVNDYRDWGIPLGRRFRALKLWFVIRSYGVEGLQATVRRHITIARWLEEQVIQNPAFELMAPRTLNTVCFRYHPVEIKDAATLDRLNETLMLHLNKSGEMLLSHTRVGGAYTIRLVVGQTYVESRHVEEAWKRIKDTATAIELKNS